MGSKEEKGFSLEYNEQRREQGLFTIEEITKRDWEQQGRQM